MVKLFKTALFTLGFFIVIAVVLVVTGNGNILHGFFNMFVSIIKHFWMWLIGLFGFIVASFKKILSIFGPSQAEKEIASENESIKEELERLREQLKTYDEQFKKEKELFAREVALYKKEIQQKELEIQTIKQTISEKEELGPGGYFHNLSDEEKKEYYGEYYNNARVFN